MANIFSVEFSGMDSFSATHHGAGSSVSAAASADSCAMVCTAAAALGPIGATYLAAFAPAVCNHLAAARLVAHVHHAIGDATTSSKAAVIAADNA
jgi:hypothetical protein